mgnify:CR=1 FL=1
MILFAKIIQHIYACIRRLHFTFLSEASYEGKPIKGAPLLTYGKGRIHFGSGVRIGWIRGKSFWNSYIFCDARESTSQIFFGNETWIGNDFSAVSEGPGIFIGERVLIGTHVDIYDSDFHPLSPENRLGGEPKKGAVTIQDNVWIGNRVTILKGTTIGAHSVVAAGSVVSGTFPERVLIGGVPARVIRSLE